jgi:hypothetical protein
MEQIISIEKQKMQQIHEALEIAVYMLDIENQPPQFTLTEVFPKIQMSFHFVSTILEKQTVKSI